MPAAQPAGILVAVEGLDGSGKTTFSRALADGLGAYWTTTPDPAVRVVRDVIDSVWEGSPSARRLFYAASVLACSDACGFRLARGETVVVDRYWASTLAYACLEGTRVPLVALESSIRPADITFFLWAPHDLRGRRLGTRAVNATDRASLDRARRLDDGYARALEAPLVGRVVRLDARRSTDDLVREAAGEVGKTRPHGERGQRTLPL